MGISGNKHADSAAKATLQKDVSNCLISHTDTYQYISQYVRDMWRREWDVNGTRLLTTSYMLHNPLSENSRSPT